MSKIVLDAEAFKALSSDTRLQILKALDARPLTVSEMGRLLSLNKATVFEHLKQLSTADLVKKIEDDARKWVYYKLTWKGRSVVHPENAQFMLMLVTSVLSVGGVVATIGSLLRWWGATSRAPILADRNDLDASSPTPSPVSQQHAPFSGDEQKSGAGAAPSSSSPTSQPARDQSPLEDPAQGPALEPTPGEATPWYEEPNVWLLGLLTLVILLSAFLAWQFFRQRRHERKVILGQLAQFPPESNPEPG